MLLHVKVASNGERQRGLWMAGRGNGELTIILDEACLRYICLRFGKAVDLSLGV